MPDFMHQQKDGRASITIYTIEARFPPTASKHYRDRWYSRELGPESFGERHAKHNERWERACPTFLEYGAGGECWQRTGYRGFVDEDQARAAMSLVLRHAKPDPHVAGWRLVRRTVAVDQATLMSGPGSRITVRQGIPSII
jgi:hypothetical protein